MTRSLILVCLLLVAPGCFPDLAEITANVGPLNVDPIPNQCEPGELDCQEAKLRPSEEPRTRKQFGSAVAIHNDVIAIKAISLENSTGVREIGVVDIYRYDGTNWVSEAQIYSPAPRLFGSFGRALSLEGDALVVASARSAYVFRRQAESWVLEQQLTPLGNEEDAMSTRVGLSGDIATVSDEDDDRGCPDNDPDCDAGAVMVYRYDGLDWTLEAELINTEQRRGNLLQVIEGDWILVANFGEGVAVYEKTAGSWELKDRLVPSDASSTLGLVRDLAFDGEVAIVSMFGRPAAAAEVYVFRRNGNTWTQEARLVPEGVVPTPNYGRVAIDGTVALVVDPESSVGAGTVYVFRFDGTTWRAAGTLKASDAFAGSSVAPGDAFGSSVAAHNGTAVVGAPRDIDFCGPIIPTLPVPFCGSGSAYVFKIGQ